MQPLLRHPPSFLLTPGRDPAWSLLNAGCAGMGAAALLLALSLHWGAGVWWAAPLVPLIAAAWWRWAAPRVRHLRWDGEAWQLQARSGEEIVVQVIPALDFDSWLLLRLAGPGWRAALVPQYLALSQHRHAAEWGLLRATLHAERATSKAGAVL
ncbi:hypothetical protein J7U46_05460 [Pelomonas sp. V22]|uniref:hypothetical protein n=1 Tax=Pelomonas sp. V22 TaxID=2822139 RepID=UPI0024A7CE75|nr:hypothetical protein [Pelomonas sp. V22]MDI4632484.1 hypothetical protein [Pelomonas sp. V22]